MKNVSERTKIKQHRGEGEGADYKPWIQVREFSSSGLSYMITDWKHGRQIHLLSTVEHDLYYTLRWNDRILDIREQFPLDIQETQRICKEFGIKHPTYKGKPVHMTSDMLVTTTVPKAKYFVCSAKYDGDLSKRTMEKLFVEKQYWLRKGIPYFVVTRDMLNTILVDNIRLVTEFYDPKDVYTDMDFLKHLISRKVIIVQMDNEILDFKNLLFEYSEKMNHFRNIDTTTIPISTADFGSDILLPAI